METIFKQGDKVFDAMFGWGFVHEVGDLSGTPFPVRCHFNKFYTSYTYEGELYSDAAPTLSFTEYTLEGFSQERPEPLPKPGDIVWVRDTEYDSWMITYFRRFSTDAKLRYGTNSKNSDDSQYIYYYKYLTTKNPYANE
jgi:hypothetical protein